MRIAQVSTLAAPVHQNAWGSVESLVWLLTRELLRLGHQVTVFGIAGAETDAEIVATLPGQYGAPGSPDDWQLCEWINLCRAIEQSGRFDVIHSHAYLWGLPLQPLSKAPMVHTMHIVPDKNAAKLWEMWPGACVTAVSQHQFSAFPHLRPAAIVPHGVDVSRFTWRETPNNYVCYLGRFVSSKGPVQAIQTARSLGLRLLVAGPENPYYRSHIAPLVDGKSVEYVGFVQGTERDKLLGGARALLCPLQYPEPFGLVMVEAMLCGTPVATVRIGAVPEIVEEGIGGCSAVSMEQYPQAVLDSIKLDRRRVRASVEKRFSLETMAQGYLRVYEKALAQAIVV